MKFILVIFFLFSCQMISHGIEKNDNIKEVSITTSTKKYKERNDYKYYLPSLIALLTVLISSTVAYKVAKINIDSQQRNIERQITSQLAIASDQLNLTNKQIQQTAINTMEQVRANNISQARIAWLNELRVELTKYYCALTTCQDKIGDLLEKVSKKEIVNLDFTYLLGELRESFYRVSLYLNLADQDHKNLYDQMGHLLFRLSEKVKDSKISIYSEIDESLKFARIVLKKTWEDAKNDIKFKV